MTYLLIAAAAVSATPRWSLSTSLTHVLELSEGSEGVWAATTGGVFLYDPSSGTFPETLQYPDGPPGVICTDVMETAGGALWVSTREGGLALRQGGSWSYYTSFEGIPGSGGTNCLEEAGGYVWVGTDMGMARGGVEGFVPVDESSSGGAFPTADVTDIVACGDSLWVATAEGVYRLDLTGSPFVPGDWARFEETATLGIYDLAVDPDSGQLGAGPAGVYIRRAERWEPSLESGNVTEVAWTSWGAVAGRNGVFLLRGGSWERIGGEYPESVIGLYYADGFLETGMAPGLLCGLGSFSSEDIGWGLGLGLLPDTAGSWSVTTIPGQPAKSIYQITVSGDRLYLGSHKSGLLGSFPEGWRVWTVDQGLPAPLRIYACETDGEDGVWCAAYHYGLTWVGGAATWDPSDDTVLTFVADSIHAPYAPWVYSPLLNNQVLMLERQGDHLWVPQEAFWQSPDEPSGLVAVGGTPRDTASMTWTLFEPSPDGLARKNLGAVRAFDGDMLWVDFQGDNGCQLLDHGGTPEDRSDDTWYPEGAPFGTDDGLPSGLVYCFARDSSGNVLVGTGDGLAIYDGAGSFSTVSGVGGSVEALEVDSGGRIWCLGSEGITVLSTEGVTVYDASNSPYLPYERVEAEFSALAGGGDGVLFSSGTGLWSVSLPVPGPPDRGGACFYPQPFLPSEGAVYLCGLPEGEAVTVRLFALDGTPVTEVGAACPASWSWDGTAGGEEAATGIYIAVVEQSGSLETVKLALVR